MSEAMDERRAAKDRLLETALMHAAFDGWSRRTLLNAAADAGIDSTTARRLFPQGGDSLLDWLDGWLDRQMVAALAGEDLLHVPVRRRVARIVRARFEVMAPHREAMRRAMVARSLPTQLGTASRALWRTVDLIWQTAGMPGNAEEGWSWYTRRASLAGVLSATFLYWLEDQSEDHVATWAFLDRRIEDVMRIGRWRGRVQDIFDNLPGLKRAG
jgi:ubiquinone biosynthesis protein COQ9